MDPPRYRPWQAITDGRPKPTRTSVGQEGRLGTVPGRVAPPSGVRSRDFTPLVWLDSATCAADENTVSPPPGGL